MVATVSKPAQKDKQRPRRAAYFVVGFVVVVLVWVWWAHRHDRMDRALLHAVLEGEPANVHEMLEAGADPNAHFSIISEKKEKTTFLESLASAFRSHAAERRPNDKTALLVAVGSDHIEIARDLLNHGADVNVRMTTGTTPLLFASVRQKPATALLLLEYGADWHVHGLDGLSPLQLAARAGNVQLVQALLQKGASVSERDKHGWTPLVLAADKGQDSSIKVLLDHGAKVSELGVVGGSPLQWVAERGSATLMARLWDTMDEKSRAEQGLESLQAALLAGRTDAAKFLFDRGLSLSSVPHTGSPPLVSAAVRGNISLVELLLKQGANVNEPDRNGGTPLMRANNLPLLADILLKHGADPNAKDKNGRTAMMQCYSPDAIHLLVAAGAKVNLKDKDGMAPLHYSASADITRLLLDAGADPNIANNEGVTPLMTSAQNQSISLVQLLLDRGARVNAADSYGRTALGIVRRFRDEYSSQYSNAVTQTADQVMQVLSERGAVVSVPRSQWRGTPLPFPARVRQQVHNEASAGMMMGGSSAGVSRGGLGAPRLGGGGGMAPPMSIPPPMTGSRSP